MSEKTAVSIEKKKETDSGNCIAQREISSPFQSAASPVEHILFLQRTIGNHVVGRLIRSGNIQTKLKIGQPGDEYEREADRVAEQVMRMPEPQNVSTDNYQICRACPKSEENELKRQPIKEEDEEDKLQKKQIEEEDEEKLQPKENSGSNFEVDPRIENHIQSMKGGGKPLPEGERVFFEPRFGVDFSHVRVHTDTMASETAHEVNARAFTIGHDVVFGRGEYAPGTGEGRRLLGHELTHVVQQSHVPLNQYVQRRPNEKKGRNKGKTQEKPLIRIDADVKPANIDRSKGIDEITHDFYSIPIEILPPNAMIPAGPVLTIGPYGCGIRRYGLTVDDFSLEYTLEDKDIESSSRPFITGSDLSAVECWASQVRFKAKLRQSILIPKDLKTHPCTKDEDPEKNRQDIMAHERLHEKDNKRALQEMASSLRSSLSTTFGIGHFLAMVRITNDPESFVAECSENLRKKLNKIRDEHDILYHRFSSEFASVLDPHDTELHTLKQKLLEKARERSSGR